jgi:phosphoinositide-3-kinase regulatory subunit 4
MVNENMGPDGGDTRYQLDEDTLANFRSTVTEEMDVFSTGCVLAEMWTDGRTVFNLSEMFAYRDGGLGLEGILDNIEDQHVRVSAYI